MSSKVGVLAHESTTPAQQGALDVLLESMNPKEIHYPWPVGKVSGIAAKYAPCIVYNDGTLIARSRDVIRQVEMIVALPQHPHAKHQQPGVWSMIGYARHRRLPVVIIMPDGHVEEAH